MSGLSSVTKPVSGSVPVADKGANWGQDADCDCFDCYREELLIYLVYRFGSLAVAERIARETRLRLGESNILGVVGNPHIYLISFALSVGLQLMTEDRLQAQALTRQAAAN
ncbi:MAG: hypothetical protein AAGC78_12500 [Cellvibrio sp.]|uniref:hypothetical protein n=1 Tax=Cellvibrio sp. TaxID=1965322 RepID=UPI0031A65B15